MSQSPGPDFGQPAKPELFHGLQLLRAVAAISVAVYHWAIAWFPEAYRTNAFDRVVSVGSAGVDLFFVISGFVIYTSTSGEPSRTTAGTFFLRRFRRIYPLYWILLAVIVAARLAGFSTQILAGAEVELTPWSLIQNILLFPTEYPVLGVAWTLSFEIYFYAIFGLLLFIRRPIARAVALAAMITAITVVARLVPQNNLSFFFQDSVVFEFLLGVLIAAAFERYRGTKWPTAWWIAPMVAVLFLSPWFVAYDWDEGLEPRLLWMGLPCAVIVAASLGIRFQPGRLRDTVLLLGDASYAIYLVHTFFILAYVRFLRAVPLDLPLQIGLGVVGLIVSCLAGVAVHILVERPLRGLFRRQSALAPAG